MAATGGRKGVRRTGGSLELRVECSVLRKEETREVEWAGRWDVEGRGRIGTEWCASVTQNHSTGLVPLSIVNYMVLRSNGE